MPPDLIIREATCADYEALERLAQLDSAPTPTGQVLVAAVDGELRAALPLDGGRSVADPFHPTAALTSLLVLRARQLSAPAGRAVPATRRRRLLVAVPGR